MKTFFKKFFFIIGGKIHNLFYIFPIILIAGFLDLISIGMLIPLISFIVDPENIIKYNFFNLNINRQNAEEYVGYFVILIASIFIIRSFFSIYLNYLIVKFSANQDRVLKNKLIFNYLSMPYSTFVKRNRAEYVHSANYMTSQFTAQVLMNILIMTSSSIIGLMIICLLAFTNIKLFFISVLLFSTMIFIYDLFLKNTVKEIGENYNLFNTKMIKSINESIDGFQEIRAYDNKEFFINRFKSSTAKTARYQLLNNLFSTMPKYIFETVIIIFGILAVFLLIDDEHNSLIEVFQILAVFTVAAIRLLPMANLIMVNILNIRHSRHTVDILYDDLNLTNFEGEEIISQKEKFECIELKNVYFKYPGTQKYVLENLNLKIQKKEFIGISGKSGSGKTTLINCILGLINPEKGEVIFNNTYDLNFKNRKKFESSYIPQQLFFLDDKIITNITLEADEKSIDLNHLYSCIEKVKLTKLINELPNGLNTEIGERGIRLSGGQAQRIVLARALYHNSNFLVMDEATNELDLNTEESIISEIKELREELTLIIISHRPETLKICDKVYKFNAGKLTEI